MLVLGRRRSWRRNHDKATGRADGTDGAQRAAGTDWSERRSRTRWDGGERAFGTQRVARRRENNGRLGLDSVLILERDQVRVVPEWDEDCWTRFVAYAGKLLGRHSACAGGLQLQLPLPSA